MLEGAKVARTRRLLTLLKGHWREFILRNRCMCGALLLAEVYIVKFVFFNFISVLNNLQTFLCKKSKRTGDKADSVICIVTVPRVFTWWQDQASLFAERQVPCLCDAHLFLVFRDLGTFSRILTVYSSTTITGVNSVTEGILLFLLLLRRW